MQTGLLRMELLAEHPQKLWEGYSKDVEVYLKVFEWYVEVSEGYLRGAMMHVLLTSTTSGDLEAKTTQY